MPECRAESPGAELRGVPLRRDQGANWLKVSQPPLRLLLGTDAVDGLREYHESILAELTEWEELSRSTAVS
ncbi:hypothetical protein GCM10009744_04690 [Kribbella alba]|uniref:Uncharacterized protein n=1 Tax=Kribbella alba TaxID=190197 RepID=A0ABN2EX56_9ACTN